MKVELVFENKYDADRAKKRLHGELRYHEPTGNLLVIAQVDPKKTIKKAFTWHLKSRWGEPANEFEAIFDMIRYDVAFYNAAHPHHVVTRRRPEERTAGW